MVPRVGGFTSIHNIVMPPASSSCEAYVYTMSTALEIMSLVAFIQQASSFGVSAFISTISNLAETAVRKAIGDDKAQFDAFGMASVAETAQKFYLGNIDKCRCSQSLHSTSLSFVRKSFVQVVGGRSVRAASEILAAMAGRKSALTEMM